MINKKIQWHPGFVAAMNLELADNRENLIFEKEYNLNTKPLEIDLLIIRKNAAVRLENEIGRIFRGHNILEYKSPEDHLDIDAFYKAGAYAALYKSYGRSLDERPAEDITVSLLRDIRPEGLFQYLKENGYGLTEQAPGIYYVESRVLFHTQIIVTGELEKGSHAWLRALSENLEREELRELVDSVRGIRGKESREFADSVLSVSIAANMGVTGELKGEGAMYEALMEIMEPDVRIRIEEGIQEGIQQGMQKYMQQGMQQGIQQGREEGIHNTVELLREFGHEETEIRRAIMKKYGLTSKKAREYL